MTSSCVLLCCLALVATVLAAPMDRKEHDLNLILKSLTDMDRRMSFIQPDDEEPSTVPFDYPEEPSTVPFDYPEEETTVEPEEGSGVPDCDGNNGSHNGNGDGHENGNGNGNGSGGCNGNGNGNGDGHDNGNGNGNGEGDHNGNGNGNGNGSGHDNGNNNGNGNGHHNGNGNGNHVENIDVALSG